MCQVVGRHNNPSLIRSQHFGRKKLSWVARVRTKNGFKHQPRELDVDSVLDSEPLRRLECAGGDSLPSADRLLPSTWFGLQGFFQDPGDCASVTLRYQACDSAEHGRDCSAGRLCCGERCNAIYSGDQKGGVPGAGYVRSNWLQDFLQIENILCP